MIPDNIAIVRSVQLPHKTQLMSNAAPGLSAHLTACPYARRHPDLIAIHTIFIVK